jgi:HEAT repeat protein
VAALKDEYWPVREYAAEALGEIGDGRAIEPLIAALGDGEPSVGLEAEKALGKIGAPAVEPLIAVLQNKAEERIKRCRTACALGHTRDNRAVDLLISLLADKEEEQTVRWNAAIALGEIKDRRAVEPLLESLNDETFRVKNNILIALGEIGDIRAIEPLTSLLHKKIENYERKEVVVALGKIRDPRVVEPLSAALKDKDCDVRRLAAKALGETKYERAVEPLIAALAAQKSDTPYSDERIEIARSLWQIGGARAEEALLAGLKEKDMAIVFGACPFFIERGDEEAEPIIADILNMKTPPYSTLADVADYCMFCGNSRLEKAARKVARNYGWDINDPRYKTGPRWGSKRRTEK